MKVLYCTVNGQKENTVQYATWKDCTGREMVQYNMIHVLYIQTVKKCLVQVCYSFFLIDRCWTVWESLYSSEQQHGGTDGYESAPSAAQ